MKYRTITIIKKCSFLLLFVFCLSCSSHLYVEERANEWISRPLADLKQSMSRPDSYASKIGWQETTYPLANGYYVFVQPIGKECLIHWKINPRDIIVDYSSSGSSCEQKDTGHVDNFQKITPPSSAW